MTSQVRQRDRAAALVAGHGRIVAEFFDVGQSRTLAWARRRQAAALVAELADPQRAWDAIVIGEYGAFYGGQYAPMAPRRRQRHVKRFRVTHVPRQRGLTVRWKCGGVGDVGGNNNGGADEVG